MAKRKTANKKRNKYQIMLAAQKNYCKTGSDSAKKRREKAEDAYMTDAVEKGNKTKSEAKRIVSKNRKCSARK